MKQNDIDYLVDIFEGNPVGLKRVIGMIHRNGRDENDLLLSGALGVGFLVFVFAMGYLVRGAYEKPSIKI